MAQFIALVVVFVLVNEPLKDRQRKQRADARAALIEAEENYRDAIKYRNQFLREGRPAGEKSELRR
ncbi:MAG: hypothetical protein WBW93_14445 [Steroidobacteraceae bacterium]